MRENPIKVFLFKLLGYDYFNLTMKEII
jgi:hypothetical protein